MSLTLEDFPTEIVEPINALNDKRRRRIILSLLEKDSLSYSEIQNGLNVKKGTLNHHLNVLIGSGLVQNFSVRSPGSPYNSYYTISNFGHKFLTGIRQSLEPREFEIIELTSTTMLARRPRAYGHRLPVSANTSEGDEEMQYPKVLKPNYK